MRQSSIDALIRKYKKIKTEKKAAERAKRDEKKKKQHHDEIIMRRAERAKAHRAVVMYQLHLKRRKRAWTKENNKVRRRRINHRYYIRHIKRPKIRRRLHKGDEQGRFIIFFTRNRMYYETYAWYIWKLSCIDAFKKLVKENNEKVICKKFFENSKAKDGENPVQYEILIKKKINPETEENESVFRDDYGAAVSVRTDDPEWIIIEKEPWYIEEDFYVYGYHPKFDRKTAGWIIDNIVKEYSENRGLCRVFVWKAYVFFENDSDFTFAMARSYSEAMRFYNILYERTAGYENVFFTGSLYRGAAGRWVERIMEKTGWKADTINRCRAIMQYCHFPEESQTLSQKD